MSMENFAPLMFAGLILVMLIGFPVAFSLSALGLLCGRVVRDKRIVPVVFALVISHWVLDFVTHRPDLPLYPGSGEAGLGLWNSVPLTLAVELFMYAAGLWAYRRATRPRDSIGRWTFGGFAVFLLVVYLANLSGPPPSVQAIGVAGIAGGALLLGWARWMDHHRQPNT